VKPRKGKKPAEPPVLELKVVPIGNSKGVRLPRPLLAKYHIGETVLLEVRDDGLLLRGKGGDRLSWEETYKQAAREREDWSDLEATLADGLDEEDW